MIHFKDGSPIEFGQPKGAAVESSAKNNHLCDTRLKCIAQPIINESRPRDCRASGTRHSLIHIPMDRCSERQIL